MINAWNDESSLLVEDHSTSSISLIHDLFSSHVIISLSYLIDDETADEQGQVHYDFDSNEMSFIIPSSNQSIIIDPSYYLFILFSSIIFLFF